VALAQMFEGTQSSIVGLFNMFSGGALERFSLFALGIMPYISASIIMQLMSSTIPTLEQLKKEGEAGRRKITQYTRYGTVVLATFQALGIAIALESQTAAGMPVVVAPGIRFQADHGDFARDRHDVPDVAGRAGDRARHRQRHLDHHFRRHRGRVAGGYRAYAGAGQPRHVPAVVRADAVCHRAGGHGVRGVRRTRPAAHHGELRQAPAGAPGDGGPDQPPAAQGQHGGRDSADFRLEHHPASGHGRELVRAGEGMEWLRNIATTLSPGQPIYVLLYASAIIFFCFFYTALVFNPKETAENLKKSGAFIPGIRPGEQTAGYIDGVMSRLTLGGAIYVTLVCLLPEFMIVKWNVPFYFGGTSLLIVVVVCMDFMAQVQARLMSHQYESLLKKANLTGGMGLPR
jgi:preprotein translocase subunit SecY